MNDINFCLRCGKKLELKKDRENKTRPLCQNCGWVFYDNPIPAAACVVLNEKNELLIIKRKFAPKVGEWALPSGYMEVYQTPEQTAIDELQEETGLIAKIDEFLGYFSGPSPIYKNIINFGFLMKVTGGKLQAGDDAAEAKFVPLANLPEICFASHRYFIEKIMKELMN